MHERLGELETLFHSGGVFLGGSVSGLAQFGIVEHFVGTLHGVGMRHAGQPSGIVYITRAAHTGNQAIVLGHEPDALADQWLLAPDVEPQHLGIARRGGRLPEQDADERALARTVGTEQTHDTGVNRKRDAAQRGDSAVSLDEPVA